jgi:hypothetical protein
MKNLYKKLNNYDVRFQVLSAASMKIIATMFHLKLSQVHTKETNETDKQAHMHTHIYIIQNNGMKSSRK